uniref:Putative salivary lipocalin n=1 Tax=Triatoma infestans TaxID=30076 RepID=A0A023FD80_TRIIF
MKTIIAVTLLGILMHAYAKECELKQPASNFNSDQYFSIPRVYVTHSKTGQQEVVCRKYETTKNEDGTSVTVTSPDGGTSSGPTVTCTNTPKTDKNGQFSIECVLPQGGTYQVSSSVLATDNQNYAVLQRCDTSGQEDILVLQTNKDGVNEAVTKYIEGQGWNINDWMSRGKANC